ncbi:hypothetical protein L486_05452 [Kwoniella mangroviensis CBS 10435]|uniref:Protein CPL1-like domain-containing protein n=1 Tax=Kwoniella mangroviensis CBS 10435 TaxID=1331196 RepID=A0A1B9IML1_9TREE|nr:hypothetical protein L486_05452 [Kwoniella mangroviensis CBS 10435]
MKFSPSFAFVALATLASSASAKSSRRGADFTPNNGLHRLASRQVVTANICENIPLDVPLDVAVCQDTDGNDVTIVPGLDLTGLVCSLTGASINVEVSTGICLCLAAGVLTDDSIADIRGLVDIGGTNIDLLLTDVQGLTGYTVDTLVDALIGDATTVLSASTTDCVYPDGATPNSCEACTFDCPEGEAVCGDQCIAEGDTCASGIARRKRGLLGGNANFLCTKGQTACAIPSSRFFTHGGYECVDTHADVESCGGCTFAFPGQTQGQDCTALPNAIDVACNAGSCVVQQCAKGFEPNFYQSGCVPLGSYLGFTIAKRTQGIDLKLSPLTDLIKNLTGVNVDPKVIELDLLKDDVLNIEKRDITLNLDSLTGLIKNLTGVDVDVKQIDLDLLKGDLLNVEKRSTEDAPIINLDLESITELLGINLNDIDVELFKAKLAKIQKRTDDSPILTLDLESITGLLGVDLNDIDVELLKAKLAKIQKKSDIVSEMVGEPLANLRLNGDKLLDVNGLL